MDNGKISYHGEEVFLGIDVHRHNWSVTATSGGEVVKRWKMEASGEKLVEMLERNFKGAILSSAYEAGFSGFSLDRKLRARGVKNIVVHASAVESCKHRVKTDKRDSAKLSQQLAAGRLQGVRIPPIQQEHARQLTRTRAQLVQQRTRIMNQIRMRLHYLGLPVPEKSKVLTRRFVRAQLLDSAPDVTASLNSLLNVWDGIETEVKSLNKLLALQAKQDPLEATYRSIPGIGSLSARILSNELGDMSQFSNERALFSFTGLTPREYSSGDSRQLGHISRHGPPALREILVEAAWQAVRRDPQLREFFERVSIRAGKKRAIVATARKIIGIARALFKNGTSYELNRDN